MSGFLRSKRKKNVVQRGAFFTLVLSVLFLAVARVNAVPKDTFPRLANYYLAWNLTDSDVEQLATWDLVILDMENQVTNPDKLRKLRELNPHIVLLAYVTSQEIRDDALTGASKLRQKLASGIKPEWYLYNLKRQKISFFPGTSMLNMTPNCPTIDEHKWNKYLAEFVHNDLAASGLWDGVFYDNTWQDITWFTKDQADTDRNGLPDKNVDEAWRAGYRFLFNETRRLVGPTFLIIGNMGPGHKQYRDETNGAMLELFPQFGWPYAMSIYDFQAHGADRFLIINGSTLANNRFDYRRMRFTLASALLEGGYYSFDNGGRHGELWRYDEYGINLGKALGAAAAVSGAKPFADTAVWKREFTNGIVLVNPLPKPQTVVLPTDFEKIYGHDDRITNNGQVTDRVVLAPEDGLIMLKTFEAITESVFTNGAFVRFFDVAGYRTRNGIFASAAGLPAGAQVYVGDLSGDGSEEKVVVTGAKLEIYNRDGQVIFTDYPYGSAYHGEIELSVGRLFAGKPLVIAVAPRIGSEIVVYSHIGETIKRFFPFGTRYQGGFTLALAMLAKQGDGQLIVGTGRGRPGEVLVYNADLGKAVRRFYAFAPDYTGGIVVAAGNLIGTSEAEIIAYPETGTARHLKIFTSLGKKLDEYPVRGVLGSFDARLGVADVNHDGRGEIIFREK